MSARQLINDVRAQLRGTPAFLAGSLVAEDVYGMPPAHSDVDIFYPTPFTLISSATKLMDKGYTIDQKFERVWERWLDFGMGTWHTNSLRLHSPHGVETNLVYKLWGKQPVRTLSMVLESFDFGLLGAGWDLKTDTFRDMRSYLFGSQFDKDPMGPLPLMPSKRNDWRAGFISQYNGLRESARYTKYIGYGYDLSLVKDDLVTGYRNAALYLTGHFKPEKQQLGLIYNTIADYIERDDIVGLESAHKLIDFNDPLDAIMEALE